MAEVFQPTSHTPAPVPVHAGQFRGDRLRHTRREKGGRDWLLILTLEGGGEYRDAFGHAHTTSPGEATLYAPGLYQEYRVSPAPGHWDLLYAHFLPRPGWLPWLAWPPGPAGAMLLRPDADTLQHVIRRMEDVIRLESAPLRRHEDFALNALEEVLLHCDSVNPRHGDIRQDARVRKAMEYLATHLRDPFSEDALAAVAGLSPSRLRHVFREQIGIGPREFLEDQRMRRARELLALSNQNIAEIAREIGFDDPFYFSQRFKKKTGESPRAFRRRTVS